MLKKRFFKTKNDCEVTFEVQVGEAESATLVCEVNNWEPVVMKKTKGAFRTKMRVPKEGRFQFRYLVNENEWVNEEQADAYCGNEFGGTNSVVDTTPPRA